MILRGLTMLGALLATTAAAQPIGRSAEGARALVERYYAAIDRGDYRTAYRLWNGGKDYSAFVQGFARTAHTRVFAGAPSDGEGAAGSTFVTVPVRVEATLKNGTHQHFAGSYVLRHANDAAGAAPGELRWHITAATLRAVR